MKRGLVTLLLTDESKDYEMFASKVTFTNRLRLGNGFGYVANCLILFIVFILCNLVTKKNIYSIKYIGKYIINKIPYSFRENTRAKGWLLVTGRGERP